MAKHIVPVNPGSIVHPEFFAPNNATASPTGMSRVASNFNYVSCVQKKVILIRAQNHLALEGNGPNSTIWPHYFRTGENTSAVVVSYASALPDSASLTSTFSYVLREFSTGDITDALVEQVSHSFRGDTSAGAINPSQVQRKLFVIRGLDPDTEYHGIFAIANDPRITFVTIHEEWQVRADDAQTGVCNPDKFMEEGPIYDEHAQDLCDANNKLWRHNGAPLIGWAADYDTGDAPSTTGAGFSDILGTGPGMYLQTEFKNTRNRTTIPVKMGVKAFRDASAATAEFRLTDGTNNIDITGAVLPTATNQRWFTTTATIPTTPAQWRMQARRTAGAGTVFTCGWSLFPYEA